MATLSIDISGSKGLAQYASGNELNAYLTGDGQVSSGAFNPLARIGFLSPTTDAETAVTLDQTQNDYMYCRIYDAVNDDFYFAGGTDVWRGDGLSDTSLTRVVSLGGSNVVRDLEIYTVNGVRKLFVMYNNTAGDAQIAISALPYDSATDDITYLTATISGSFTNDSEGDIFMIASENGYGYLFMENQIHRIDGTTNGGANGTMAANKVVFPATFRIVDAIEHRGYFFVAFHKYRTDTRNANPSFTPSGDSQCGVFIWDRRTDVSSVTDSIPMEGVSIIHSLFTTAGGKLRAHVTLSDGLHAIMEYGGSTFTQIFSVGISGSHPMFRDSVCMFGQMHAWFGKDGNTYLFGKVRPDMEEGLFVVHTLSVAATNAGVILPARVSGSSAPALYVSYQSQSALANARIPVHNAIGQLNSISVRNSTIYGPVKYLPQMSTVRSVRVYMYAGGAGGSTAQGTIAIHINGSSTPLMSKTVTQDDILKGYKHIEVNKPYVNSIQLVCTHEATATLSTNNFAPSFASVEYTGTTDKG